MVKKFNAASDNQLTQTVRESAQQIWLAGLGAYAKAQEEGGKVFEALVKEGESIQKKTRQAADEKIAVVTTKATGTWDRLEQVFEDRVARALSSLGVPSKKEIDKLSKRVAELTAVVQELTEAQGGTAKKTVRAPAVAKPAAAAAPATRTTAARKAAPAKQPATPKSGADNVAAGEATVA
jgi:poly(hydroxyalkanoate) granule-associated protein